MAVVGPLGRPLRAMLALALVVHLASGQALITRGTPTTPISTATTSATSTPSDTPHPTTLTSAVENSTAESTVTASETSTAVTSEPEPAPASPPPPGTATLSYSSGALSSGCTQNENSWRIGNCRSFDWSTTRDLGGGELQITYVSDESSYRDRNDATAIIVNGATLATLVNTGCNPTPCTATLVWPQGATTLQIVSTSSSSSASFHLSIQTIVHIPTIPSYHVVASGFKCGNGSADLEARAGTYLRDPNMTPGLCRETVATTSPSSSYFAFVHSGEESPGCIVCRQGWDPATMIGFAETDLCAVTATDPSTATSRSTTTPGGSLPTTPSATTAEAPGQGVARSGDDRKGGWISMALGVLVLGTAAALLGYRRWSSTGPERHVQLDPTASSDIVSNPVFSQHDGTTREPTASDLGRSSSATGGGGVVYGALNPTYGPAPSPPQSARGPALAKYDHLTVEPRDAVYEAPDDANATVSLAGSGTVIYGALDPTYGAASSQPPTPSGSTSDCQYDHLTAEPRDAVYEAPEPDATA